MGRFSPALNSSRRRCVSYLKRDGIYAILDAGIAEPDKLLRAARLLAKSRVRVFQLRAKDTPDAAFLELALRLKKELRGRLLLINDRTDIALLAKADGVHLGQDDIPVARARAVLGRDRAVGASAGSFSEIARAARMKPDYVSLGPAFSTQTKRDAGEALGPDGIRNLAGKIPDNAIRVAVGGITADNVGIILHSGIDAVAVASALLFDPKKGKRALSLLEAVKAAKRGRCGGSGSRIRLRRPVRLKGKAGGA